MNGIEAMTGRTSLQQLSGMPSLLDVEALNNLKEIALFILPDHQPDDNKFGSISSN